jgi:hypothetical protein
MLGKETTPCACFAYANVHSSEVALNKRVMIVRSGHFMLSGGIKITSSTYVVAARKC